MSKPRILFVGAFPPPARKIFGGAVTSCRALIDSTFSKRFELVLVDSTQISNPPPRLPTRMMLSLRKMTSFIWQVERSRPDCALLFVSTGASLLEKGAMSWYARLRGLPALMFPRHGNLINQCQLSRFTLGWVRIAFGGAGTFLCQGTEWQRFAVETLGYPVHRAPVISNWTATERLLAIGKRRLAQPTREVTRVLFLGWLEREKGIFELLEAFNRLQRKCSVSLVIAGKGRAEASARGYVLEHNLSHRVQFIGWVQDQDLEDVLGDADILALPSWKEGLPNAMVEAMAAGMAVVVSAVGNVPDVVKDGEHALLVSPQDASALEGALFRVITDPGLRETLGRRGHEFALRNFSVEPAVEKLDSAIRAAMQKPTAESGSA